MATDSSPGRVVRPKFRLWGAIPDWAPTIGAPKRLSLTNLAVNIPQLILNTPLRALQAQRHLLGEVIVNEAKSYQFKSPDFHTRSVNQVPGPTASASPHGNINRDPLGSILAAILQPPLPDLFDPEGVLPWPHELHHFQKEGVHALMQQNQLLLADEMGLGKTIQVLAALRILVHQNKIKRALIVAPATLLRQWRTEAAKWAPELTVVLVSAPAKERAQLWRRPAHIHIVSYETLREDVSSRHITPVTRSQWDVMVLDEASKIKNRDGLASRAVKLVPRTRRWALTGTPLEIRVEDVHSILEFLLREPGKNYPLRPNRVKLKELLGEVQLRRRKVDVLTELPSKTVEEISLDLAPQQRIAYDAAERDGVYQLRAKGAKITISHILELIMRLKQICNIDPASGQSAKFDDIEAKLEAIVEEGHRALMFSQFTDEVFGVQSAAQRLAKYRPLTYTGAMSSRAKVDTEEKFKADSRHKLLILSVRAGGMGLNLQSASYVFHLDRWWNPAIEEQAEARAHRMGQIYPVTIYRYTMVDTVEERIERLLATRRALFAEVIDDVTMDLSSVLTRSDLFGLFELAPPTGTPLYSSDPVFGQISGEAFEQWLKVRLEENGFSVDLTPHSHDGGVDLIASQHGVVGVETRLLIQCKNLSEPVGVTIIRELLGAAPDRATGTTLVVASPSGFSSAAKALAGERRVTLWDREALERLITG